MEPTVEAFFAERKEAWRKKNISASMQEAEIQEIERECEAKFSLKNWLPDAAKRAGQISISSHPCTFSHPSARKNKNGYVTSVIARNTYRADGFLRSGNVAVEFDALGNAAALDVHKFLHLIMEDGRPLLTHIEQESDLARQLLTVPNAEFDTLRNDFLKMIGTDQEVISSSKIKQVYFLINDDEYHLLSLLTHSGHMFELRKRLDALRFGEYTKVARECRKKNQMHESGYREIYGLTTIGFGGTKPQNISVLNNQNGGKAHLLASMPPELKPRDVRLPKTDFFKDCINAWHVRDTLESLHRILKTDYNNVNIRDGRDFQYQRYVDVVIEKMWQVRIALETYRGELAASLPLEQKIWLYPELKEQREQDDAWLETVMSQMARSLMSYYRSDKIVANPVLLADEELRSIEKVIRDNKDLLR